MSQAVFFNVYKLKKGTSIPEFKQAVKDLNDAYISKFNGYVSFELMQDEKRGFWSDRSVFESMEFAEAFVHSTQPNEPAEKFYGFLNLSTCRSNLFLMEDRYEK